MPKILICSAYKTGSSALVSFFENNGYNIYFEEQFHLDIKNNIYKPPTNKNFVVKIHTKNDMGLNKKIEKFKINFDYIFTLIRNPFDIYISGYFQNLSHFCKGDTINYNYRLPRDIVNKMTFNQTLNHFMKFKWYEYGHLSIIENCKQIEECFKINYLNLEFNKKNGFSIYQTNNNNKLIILTIQTLNNTNTLKIIFDNLKLNNLSLNVMRRNNISTKKWYGKRYVYVKKNLPKNFFNKIEYQNIYKIVNSHFY